MMTTRPRIASPATEAQRAFLLRLVAEAAGLGVTLDYTEEYLDRLSKFSISHEIDSVKLINAEARKTQRTERRSTPAGITEDGMYLVDGTIYKVQRAVHGSGNLYAKVLEIGEYGSARFEYAPGVVRTLTPEHKMTLDQAREYGALYGTCVVCGRTLTNEESIAAGIGPICAGRF